MSTVASALPLARVANLSILQLARLGDDVEVVLQVGSAADRFFPPLLAAQMFLAVRGLIEQDCDSRPAPRSHGHKEGTTRHSRRWAFAQEIYSNNGRGTESGHFLEHLALQMASNIHEERGGASRVLSAETAWDFRVEPNVYRLRFYNMPEALLREALLRCQEVLGEADYDLDLSALNPH